MLLEGKVAIITGATSGIGRDTALKFANEGASVFLTGRKNHALQQTQRDIAADGGKAAYLAADVAVPEDCQKIIDAALEQFGKIDVLVNAAGVIATGSIEDTSLEDWREMMAVNLDSVFYLMNRAVPHLQKTRGNIVNVSSVTGVRSFPNVLAYCVSKSAVDQLTRCAALELAPKGVRVNAVNPGVVITELHRRSGMDDEKYTAFLMHSKSTHPLGRVGMPHEIANAILFLASSKSGWITGETLSVDGGRHLTCAR